ncbi:MAG: hypothetical protein A2Y03_04995 [Omnitrophica WOR_2 bacterium GWF2_38_59]|nr:MAG: hypothetical protein A2Y03_04995 [Omnitrophica WOR_2 bacterium GWF2_38_59]OGX48259.1 MAG: hypothetical protein A2243_10295 [Omnitrophica WOR_2 bacterium RIFOXYA2_FULL_38_17]OGX54036.1 MAG: hypothetical protein A2267_05820 [Omnitrophica WOR_2 bacterium RIFOXYA12_FULL_38_10]OGX59576.1 MAG: hypothetical protein A2447_12005 [Omnitrophica WOR_2 bacterium RIFOXYC2_FULL_38_12]OGX59968.1 MAG: hypothetical protein A2306_04540 [Omnitrophica WOR_2 bacterium RIFOXYB2_FULL_38_16]
MNIDFSGKVALIVGGTSGIGLDLAKQLSSSGAKTFVASRNDHGSLDSIGFIKCDVRDEKQVKGLVGEIISKETHIDILVNSMAINQCKPIEEISLDDWKDVVDTNITGIFLLCKEVIPHMKKRKYGKIVNISSIAGRHRSPVSGVHYVATKAAIIGFTRQLAFEAAPFGINVNVHCPSQTLTPMLKSSMNKEQIEALEAIIPLKRLATVEEQAYAVLFLCSDMSSYMSGAVLDVNGGQI